MTDHNQGRNCTRETTSLLDQSSSYGELFGDRNQQVYGG